RRQWRRGNVLRRDWRRKGSRSPAGAKFRRKTHDQLQPELPETFSKVVCVFVSKCSTTCSAYLPQLTPDPLIEPHTTLWLTLPRTLNSPPPGSPPVLQDQPPSQPLSDKLCRSLYYLHDPLSLIQFSSNTSVLFSEVCAF
ncbi:mCG140976, partial [Mus musculus]